MKLVNFNNNFESKMIEIEEGRISFHFSKFICLIISESIDIEEDGRKKNIIMVLFENLFQSNRGRKVALLPLLK